MDKFDTLESFRFIDRYLDFRQIDFMDVTNIKTVDIEDHRRENGTFQRNSVQKLPVYVNSTLFGVIRCIFQKQICNRIKQKVIEMCTHIELNI